MPFKIPFKWNPRFLIFLGILLLVAAPVFTPAFAQGEVVVTLAIPAFLRDFIQESIIEDFEARNPGIRVEMIYNAQAPTYSVNGDIEDYLDSMAEYVSAADVLALTSQQLAVEATRAGYLLDMSPIVGIDPEMNAGDFFPPLWNAFQWDRGMWAMPVSADVVTLLYDPLAFDAAGLEYPNESWTMDDFVFAIQTLTEFGAEGNVSLPAFLDLNGDISPLLLSFVGDTVVDDAVQPSVPRYDNPRLETVLDQWAQLYEDGYLGTQFDLESIARVPLVFGQSILAQAGIFDQPHSLALLPGGRTALLANGAAISAGTQHPDEAYALVKYISNSAELANAFFGVIPARRSLVGAEVEGPAAFFSNIPDEQQPIIDTASEVAFATAELRFAPDLNKAVNKITQGGLSARAALEEIEQEAYERLQIADDRRVDLVITVATPPPLADVADGEVVLNFGILSFLPQLPNQERWNQVASDFAAADAEVAQVRLDVRTALTGASLADMAEEYDCFYAGNNYIPGADLTLLRNIDPLMAADPTFNSSDFAGGMLAQVQRENATWALPLVVQPQVLWYNPDVFAQTGAPLPFPGWTISDFELSLRALRLNSDDPPPFESRGFDSSHLLVLIAAYGGLPLDYRTNPVTVNFTDPANVEAIRQVLDLAKDGYIAYSELANFSFNIFGGTEGIAMYSELLNDIAAVLAAAGSQGEDNPYRLTLFPVGSTYSALSYDLGAGYISADTTNVEACYRFLSALSLTPDLFDNMPARRSTINNPDLALIRGEETVAFYNEVDALLEQPNTILIPSLFSAVTDLTASASNFVILNWLNIAFDKYVLQDLDLETVLGEAQLFAENYQGCVAAIPPFDPALQTQQEYLLQFTNCAAQVDPSLEGVFGTGGG